ncbi:MAG: strawberry notch family protein, partial [Microcystaceae cyanobacterium]
NRWRNTFARWSKMATLQAAIALPQTAYYKMGTTFPVQILVFDKVAGELNLGVCHEADSLEMAEMIIDSLPERSQLGELTPVLEAPKPKQVKEAGVERHSAGGGKLEEDSDLSKLLFALKKAGGEKDGGNSLLPPALCPLPSEASASVIELEYQTIDWDSSSAKFTEGLYEPYELQSIVIPSAANHPCALVQSSAMASISPPKPTYRPHLPERTLEEGQLSNAQLETLIYAGDSHSKFLKGWYKTNKHGTLVQAEPPDSEAKRYRQGYFCGDSTGVGKGRQLASVLMDNWLKGRSKHIFCTISPKLLEDIKRDWSDIGGKPEQIKSLGEFKQGEAINLSQGIIFCTYATLRQGAKANKISRVDQLVNWFGTEGEGCLLMDESHALANAAPKVDQGFGSHEASAQGSAALEIQRKLPSARVVYSSATGATEVRNLAYAERLGVWLGNMDFRTRDEFICSMTAGGMAAMEIIARDLKAMGLYCSRSLSYEGVEYDLLEHQLTSEQTKLYDTYAQAYQIILKNLHRALEVSGAS